MAKDVVTVTATTHDKDAVDRLAAHAVSAAVPVVAHDGRVVGVVSEADLLHKMEIVGVEPYAGLLERKHRRTARASRRRNWRAT
jgi:CBS-domain-containing membrane protein